MTEVIQTVIFGRDREILRTAGRKVRQGFSVGDQYKALNRARDKRQRRRERNLKLVMAGGTSIPLIGEVKS